MCRPTKSPLTAAEGLAAGAVVTEDAPLVVVRGDAAGDVEGLPIPGLALGLPLVDGEPEPPVAPPAPVESAAEPSVAPAPVAPAAPALPAAPAPPALSEALAPEPPPPEALAPEPLPPPDAPAPEPLPPASAIPTASGPAASAIASSKENIAIIIFIEILLRDCALTLENYGGMMGATDMPLDGRAIRWVRREPPCGPLVGVA